MGVTLVARIDATLLLGGLLLSGDRALRALAGTSIGLGALTAHREVPYGDAGLGSS